MARCKELIDVTQSYEEYARSAIEAQWEVTNHPEHAEPVQALRDNRDPKYDR